MDIVQLIGRKMKEISENGKLDEIVEKHTISCVEDVVRDALTWSGEAKKSIKGALEGKLNIEMKELNLDRYRKIVTDLVEKEINNSVLKGLQVDISNSVRSIVEPLEKEEWLLSELIEKFIENLDKSWDGVMEEQYGTCTLIVEGTDAGYSHIYLDKESGIDKYRCEVQVDIDKEGKIYHSKVDDKAFSPFLAQNFYGFEALLFKLYCNNVKLIVDEDDCELDYTREDADY